MQARDRRFAHGTRELRGHQLRLQRQLHGCDERSVCMANDGLWQPPVFLHGALSWMQPYLGWRGWYGGPWFALSMVTARKS